MDCCLLCLELNKLLGSIETTSKQWEEFNMTKVLEKHFWPLNSTYQPNSWICLPCWKELEHFHKFYLRIEEAHMIFGRIKTEEGNQILDAKEEISQELKEFPYCLEPEILIDQNELQTVVDLKQCSETEEDEKNYVNEKSMIIKDPLKKPIRRRKNLRKLKSKIKIATKQNPELTEIKKERTDSDNYDNDNASDEDNGDCNYEPDKKPKEYKSRKEGDKFIAEHFKHMFCDLCEVRFENFSAMKKHFSVTHSIQTGYLVCCNRKFFQRSHLVDHLHCHFNPDHFKCTQCGKVLSNRKYLEDHMLRVHRPEGVAAKHSCEICGKSFTLAKVLRTHKLKHLPKEEKKFPCTECGKFYASAYLLKIHNEVIHLKKQAKVCYICGISISTSTEYKAHMNKHAGIPAPVISCDVCGLRLISERSLKLHKESQHPVGGKKDHPCPLCEKISPTARALKKHINTMHERGFDHKCTLCEKAFRRADTLKEHMATHTGTPLYTCPWCPKTYNSNGNMHTHRKNEHPKEYLELKLQKYNLGSLM